MRARYPDQHGYVERDGVSLYWELFGAGERTIFFLPTWSIVHSRIWKMQIPYFARHARVLTFDGRGNGKSDRPGAASSYSDGEFAADALAVMDATHTTTAALVSLSAGARWALRLAAHHPERVTDAVFIAPALPFASHPDRTVYGFDDYLDTDEGWARYNRHYWLKEYRGFLEFFFGQMFHEHHSTKQIEDGVRWGLETTPQTLIATDTAPSPTGEEVLDLCALVSSPVLVIQGSEDRIVSPQCGAALAASTRGALLTLEGCGHGPHARDPVKVNLAIAEFLTTIARCGAGRRGDAR